MVYAMFCKKQTEFPLAEILPLVSIWITSLYWGGNKSLNSWSKGDNSFEQINFVGESCWFLYDISRINKIQLKKVNFKCLKKQLTIFLSREMHTKWFMIKSITNKFL